MNSTVMSPSESQLATFILKNGRDFVAWSTQLESWMYEKNLWQYICGYIEDINKPDLQNATKAEAKRYFDWMAENSKAKNMMLKCLDLKYRVIIQDKTTARECWEALKDNFMKDSMILQQQLEDEFDNFRLNYSKSMESNIMDLNNLISKLKYIGLRPTEQKKCHKLMSALPKSYAPVKAIIKFATSKTNPITFADLIERIEDYAREKGHWGNPIKKLEEINFVNKNNSDSKRFQNNKTTKKIDKNFNNNQNKSTFNKNNKKKNLKCTLCEGEHYWNKCPHKDELLSMGKKLQSKMNEQNNTKFINNTEEVNTLNDQDNHYSYHLTKTNNIFKNNHVIIDSGCTIVASNNRSYFKNLKEINPIQVKQFINSNTNNSINLGGTLVLPIIQSNGKVYNLEFENAIFEPKADKTLISSAILCDKYNFNVNTNSHSITLTNNDGISINGFRNGNLYYLPIADQIESNNIEEYNDLVRWHYKLGHVSYHTLIKMSRAGIIPKELSKMNFPKYCLVCNKGKQKRSPFPKQSNTKATKVNQNILMDLLVMNKKSIQGYKYVLGCMDQFSSYDKSYYLKKKSEASKYIKQHIKFIQKFFDEPVISITTDRGGEFLSKSLIKWLKKKGIQFKLAAPKSSQQIGQRERAWRTNADMTRCLLYQANLPSYLWNFAYEHSMNIRNRIISSAAQSKSPIEKAFNIKPNLIDLKVFGSPCSVKLFNNKKLDYCSEEGIYLGINKESKAYNIWDPLNKKIMVRRDVIFNEDVVIKNNPTTKLKLFDLKLVRYTSNNNQNEKEEQNSNDSSGTEFEYEIDDSETESDDNLNEMSKTLTNQNRNTMNTNHSISNHDENISTINNNRINQNVNDSNSQSTLRRSTRQRTQTIKYGSFYNLEPNNYISPTNFKDAMNDKYADEWYTAASSEIKSLLDNNAWNIVDKPTNKPIISTTWVFKVKTNINGEIEKFKARLCARGDLQKHSIFFNNDNQSPVINSTSINILIAIAIKNDYVIQNIDINTAYLYGKINEEVYMYLPQGFYKKEKLNNKVAKLNKGIYGLKQSAKLWYETLSEKLKSIGFSKLTFDKCIFIKTKPFTIILGIYVDDILIISSNKETIDTFKKQLAQHFNFKNFDTFTDILGMRISKINSNWYISQDTYIQRILERFHYANIKSKFTPMETNLNVILNKDTITDTKDVLHFQEAIGSLLYAAIHTRPDILYAVNTLAQVSSNPTTQQFKYVKRIFQYLRYSNNLGINIDKSKEFKLSGYADASFASDITNRRSITGYVFFIDSTPISWRSIKQKLTSKSTMESELYALEEAVSECIWLRFILNELGYKQKTTTIFQDNQATIKFSNNQHRNSRNKHIDIKHCFVNQHINNGNIILEYINTNYMIADGFTKSLGTNKFNAFIKQLNMRNIKKEC